MRRLWTVSLLLLGGMAGCHHKAPSVPLPTLPVPEPRQQPSSAEPAAQESPARQPAATPQKPAPPPAEKPASPAPIPPPAHVPGETAAPAIRLERIVTPDQERQMNAAIDQNLASAETILKRIAARRLSQEQESIVSQVQSFIKQARDVRKTDLAAASSLSQRARILADDLARKVR